MPLDASLSVVEIDFDVDLIVGDAKQIFRRFDCRVFSNVVPEILPALFPLRFTLSGERLVVEGFLVIGVAVDGFDLDAPVATHMPLERRLQLLLFLGNIEDVDKLRPPQQVELAVFERLRIKSLVTNPGRAEVASKLSNETGPSLLDRQ